MKYTLQALAERVGGKVIGDKDCVIEKVNTLSNASTGDISFITSPAYRKQLEQTKASAVILRSEDLDFYPNNAIVVEEPHPAYAKIAHLLHPVEPITAGIHPSASIHPAVSIHQSASIGANCYIDEGVRIAENVRVGPGCVIEKNVSIGANSILSANVTICFACSIGKDAIIHSGVVIGADGFGQANEHGNWIKIPQLGRVIIGDDVEIGANTTIDRGAIDDTVIEDNVKLDNLIQIAHNVRIGAHTVMAACAAVAGSTKIGKHCAIGGAVAIVGHIDIADNVQITGMSLVTNSIKSPGVYSSGVPLEPNQQWHKNAVRFKQLDDMARRLKALEKKNETLQQ